MRETTKQPPIQTQERVAVDIDGLSALLSCGAATAKRIAECAEARIVVGRRVLYSVDKIRDYVQKIAI